MSKQLLPVGTLLHNNSYRIERPISSGGFGNTYVVTKTAFDKTFAMKEFFIRSVNTRVNGMVTVSVADNRSTFQSQLRKFANEAKRLNGVDHPNIVHVTDFFEENGTAYYVMDYIEGVSLRDYLERSGKPMDEEDVRRILSQMLDALQYLHSLQPILLHLDIKPANIMLTKQGHVKLIDFGASKQVSLEDDLHCTLSTMTYTPGYAPPEQMEQTIDMIGPWSDFYALGATLYRLLTFTNPPSNARITSVKQEAFQFPDSVSLPMRRLIVWMMNPDIKLRPQRVEDIRAFLSKSEKPTQPQKPPVKKTPSSRTKHNHWLYYVAGILLVALIIGVMTGPKRVPPLKASAIQVQKETYRVNGVAFSMVYVKGGTFTMGATKEQGWGVESDEKPKHKVTLSDYYIGETEVTQALWQAVMGSNPANYKGSNRPVEQVSYDDCLRFIGKLNQMTGRRFRLPTEAEWEYAARGGNRTRQARYAGSSNLEAVGWYKKNSGAKTHPVKSKAPNELGLYDMSGNVWERCLDWFGTYSSRAQTNPAGPGSGAKRIYRGGSWNSKGSHNRVANRGKDVADSRYDDLGLRLAL